VVAHSPGSTSSDEGFRILGRGCPPEESGLEGVPRPPLGDPGGLSWSYAALRGLEPGGPGRSWVPVRPARRFHALLGGRPQDLLPTRGSGIGPPCAFVLLQRRVPAAPHRSVRSSDPCEPRNEPVPRCCLSWAFVPYDTIPDRRTRTLAADPSATACRVRGLGTPLATYTTDPPGARSAGASLGFPLQGVLLVHERCPSRGLCPPDVASRTRPPRGEGTGRPPPGPCSRDELVLPPASRRKPAVDAFLGFTPPEPSPHPPGRSLVVAMPALSSFGGMTSLPAWTPGLRGSDGSAWPVSGLPALLGFRTLRPSRHSVHRPGERAHGFTSRRTPRTTRDAQRSKLPRQRCVRGS